MYRENQFDFFHLFLGVCSFCFDLDDSNIFPVLCIVERTINLFYKIHLLILKGTCMFLGWRR